MNAPTIALYHGDCIEIMRTLPENSVDAIVTDPPYGLGFMGKAWDALPPGEEWARECLRVLKPGGHLLAFGGTRTWHRLAVAVEDAGFEMRDSLAWLYGSGFPKSMNVAKAIQSGGGPQAIRKLSMGDEYAPSGRGRVNYDHGGGSAMNGASGEVQLDAAAEQWAGWGTALKPAFEPIVMARKPLIGTVAANVQTHGTGALNIDASRVHSHDSGAKTYTAQRMAPGAVQNATGATHLEGVIFEGTTTAGRWPANVVLDESMAAVLDEQSGILHAPGSNGGSKNSAVYGIDVEAKQHATYKDTGGASRFFYVAKASKRERPVVDGIAHATVKPLAVMEWLIRMVTPPGGKVLDPFGGSGTTAEAAAALGFDSIIIEREAEYLPLIAHRALRVGVTPVMPAEVA